MADSSLANWTATTGTVPEGGCLAFGKMWVALGSSVVGYDLMTGAIGPKVSGFGQGSDPRHVQPYGDLLAVACDDGRLYTVDPGTSDIEPLALVGNLNWMAACGGSLLVAGDRGLYRVASAEEDVSTPFGPLVGPYGQGNLSGAPSFNDDLVFVPTTKAGVVALDSKDLRKQWSAPTDGPVASPSFCDGPRLCYATAAKSVHVIDTETRQQLLSAKLAAKASAQPVLDGDNCYVPLENGILVVLDIGSGRQVKSFQLTEPATGNVLVNETGALFLAGNTRIFVVDTAATGTSGVEEYRDGAYPKLLGHVGGALLVADSKHAASLRLDEQIHDFYAESNLIQDFDFSAGASNPKKTPNFHVEVTVFESDGTPRANQPIRVTATEATFVAYRGQSSQLSRQQFLDVRTDGAGRFRLDVRAGQNDKSGTFRAGIFAPELLLSSPFMDPNFRLVVRPNGETQSHLASITKEQLQNAKGYDNGYVISSNYREDDAVLGSATKSINQIAGMVVSSSDSARKRGTGSKYCSSACDPTIACLCPADQPGCKLIAGSDFSFDLTTGSSNFQILTAEQTRSALSRLPSRAKRSFVGDLWDDIVSGAAKVVGAVVYTVENAVNAVVQAIKDGVTHFVDVVLDTIDKATKLIHGIFNAIASAIERVLEALSFLFDWPAILALHNQIRRQAEQSWQAALTGSGPGSLDALKSTLDDQLGKAKERADQAFEAAKNALGGRSPLSAQSEASGKANDSVGNGKEGWLMSKFQDNALPDGSDSTSSSRSRRSPPAISLPTLTLSANIRSDIDSFFSTLEREVTDDVRQTVDRVRADLDFQGDPGVLARGFAVLIDIVRGLVDVALDVAKAIVDLLINLLKKMLQAMLDFAKAPVDIPFLSAFYTWVTGGSTLSLLDLFALMTAVPTGFAIRLFGKEPSYAQQASPTPAPRKRSAAQGWINIAAGVGQLIWGVSIGIIGAIDANTDYAALAGSGLNLLSKIRLWFTIGAIVLVRGLFLAAVIAAGVGLNIVAWVIPTLSMTVDAVIIWAKNTNPDTAPLTVGTGAAFGLLAMLLSAIAIYVAKKHEAEEWLEFGVGMSVGLSLASRIGFLLKDPRAKIGAAVVVGLFIGVSGALKIAEGGIQV